MRHFYKNGNDLQIGRIQLCKDQEKRINELEEGLRSGKNNSGVKKDLGIELAIIKQDMKGKLNSIAKRKIERAVMNTRGELLFAKAIILFEGETEEQALPILAKEKFGQYAFEMGLNFIGVGGKLSYTPFLTTAKALNIPWYILSDGDGKTKNEVEKKIEEVFGSILPNVLFVLDTFDFEEYLVENGYEAALSKAIDSVRNTKDYIDSKYIVDLHGKNKSCDKKRDYKSNGGKKRAIIDCLHDDKTGFASAIAEQIVSAKDESGECRMPSVIDELFNRIATDLNIDLP